MVIKKWVKLYMKHQFSSQSFNLFLFLFCFFNTSCLLGHKGLVYFFLSTFSYLTFFHYCPCLLAFVANVAPITVQIYVYQAVSPSLGGKWGYAVAMVSKLQVAKKDLKSGLWLARCNEFKWKQLFFVSLDFNYPPIVCDRRRQKERETERVGERKRVGNAGLCASVLIWSIKALCGSDRKGGRRSVMLLPAWWV